LGNRERLPSISARRLPAVLMFTAAAFERIAVHDRRSA
jgi:hypothetical protein